MNRIILSLILFWVVSFNSKAQEIDFPTLEDATSYIESISNFPISNVAYQSALTGPSEAVFEVRIWLTIFTQINVRVKLTHDGSKFLSVKDVTSTAGGVPLAVSWQQVSYSRDLVSPETITISVYGDMRYQLFISGFMTIYIKPKTFTFSFNYNQLGKAGTLPPEQLTGQVHY